MVWFGKLKFQILMVRFGKSWMVWFGESRFRKNGLVWTIKILIWFGLTYLKMIKLQVTGLTSLDISDNRIQIFSHRYFKIKKGVFDMLVVFCLSSPKYVLSSICHILSLSGPTWSYPFAWSYSSRVFNGFVNISESCDFRSQFDPL